MSLIQGNILVLNPDNLTELRAVMDRHGEAYATYFGANERGEDIQVTVTHDRLALRTYQSNGWQRVDVYRREGTHSVSYDPGFRAA